MKWLKYCKVASHYTLCEFCHGSASSNPHPAKFNPLELHAGYRRRLKGLA